MKKTTIQTMMGMAVFLMLVLSACNAGGAPATQPAAPVNNAPVEQVPPAADAPAQSFAPACQNATSCAAPAVADTEAVNTYCVEKIPYQNISVPPGTTFETLDPTGKLKCQDSGAVVDGMNVITCTGAELIAYDLKLTNSACSASNLAVGTGQCQEGQGFDATNNCCAPVGSGDASITIKVNMGACPSS